MNANASTAVGPLTSNTTKLRDWREGLRDLSDVITLDESALLWTSEFRSSKDVAVYKLTFEGEKVAVKSISVCVDHQNRFERDERSIALKLIANAQPALSLPHHKHIAQMREFAYIQQTVDNTRKATYTSLLILAECVWCGVTLARVLPIYRSRSYVIL